MSKINPKIRDGVPRCSRTECQKFELHNAHLRSGMCLVNEVSFGPDAGDVCEPAVIADRRDLFAHRAMAGWRNEDFDRRVISYNGSLYATQQEPPFGLHCVVASATDHPTLATSLGIDWEETDDE